MPAWKKVIVSGSAASFASIQVSGNITASIVSASQFTGSLFGTASWARNAITASYVTGSIFSGGNSVLSASYAFTASYALNVTSTTTGANRKLTQSTPSTTWSFNHNLGERYPVIETYDTNGASIIPGRIETVDSNNLFVYFDDATAGTLVATVGGTATTTLADTASYVTGSIFTSQNPALSASYALTASYALNGGSGTTFPYNGNAVISGSLTVTGSTNLIGNTQLTGSLLLTQSYISTVDYIDFTKTVNPAHAEGRIHWVDDTKTLQVDTDVANLMIELGHQQAVRVRNENPFTIAKGKIIYISGSSGNRPLIFTSSIETDIVSAVTVGMVAADIAQNNNGYVITRGTIRDINTNAYNAGQLLYLSTSGDYTTTAPEAPLHEVRLGKVVTQATAGIIYIDIMNGYEIGELHDVVDTNGQIGDLLVRSGSSPNDVWKNTKQLTGSYGVTGSWNVIGNVSATSLTGSITASSLQGDIILGTQTSGQYASTITAGLGITSTTANANDGTAYTVTINTSSAHFLDGVKNELNTEGVISGSVSSPSQGTISVGGFTNIDLGLQTNDNVTFNNITSTGNVVIQGNLTAQQFIVSSSVYFTTTSFSSGSTIFGNDLGDTHQFTGSLRVLGSITGSISASNLVGDIILGTQTSGQYASTIVGGAGLTATAANATDGTAYTIDAVAGAGISLTAPTNDAINIDTGSAHFNGGVKNKNNTDAVLSGSVSSPSQGTISVGGFANIDLGVQTTDNVTFNTVTGTNGLTGSITASSLQGAILNNQLQNSSVTVGTTAISLGGSATTIAGIASLTSTNITGSTISASNFISGGQIIAATGFTGSLSASFLKGAILNNQLQNSSVTVGTTAINLGSSATTITGLVSLNSTSITASIVSASSFTGSLLGTASFASNVVGGYVTTVAGTTNQININGGTAAANGAVTVSLPSIINLGAASSFTATGLTGSLTASSLQGAILNSQLQNSSVTIGNTAVSLGGTATTITGLTSVTSTNFVGTASYVTGSIHTSTNPALSASYALTASYALNGGGGSGTPGGSTTQIQYNNGGSFGGVSVATFDGTTFRATGSFTGSFKGDGSGLTNLGFGNTRKLAQDTAATTWSFTHNMAERYPVINVYDNNNNVVVPGRIESVDENTIRVYFQNATAGTAVVSVGGNATTASYISNAVTIGTTNLVTEVTSSLGIATTTVSRVWTGSYSGAFWEYVVNNSTNFRAGTVMGVWNKAGSVQYTDTSTPDIGDTSQLTFAVVMNVDYAELRATTTTSGWNVKTFKRSI